MLSKIWMLSTRQLYDLECLLNGAFSPLTGFLNEEDYLSTCNKMRLADGTLWPMPVTLDVPESFATSLQLGEEILLTNLENTPLAILTVGSIWQPDKAHEALSVFGTLDKKHPAVRYLYEEAGDWYVGGKVTLLSRPVHYDFVRYRHTPEQLKAIFNHKGWSKIIAFQTRNPMHKAHYELTKRATEAVDAHLLIHPVVGMTKPGDVDAVTRIKCYEKILKEYPAKLAMLSLLPLAMRMGGPREAVWHALIRKNYGVTHFIVGRDHAGPGALFYEPYAAQRLVLELAAEIGIEILDFPAVVYSQQRQVFLPVTEVRGDDMVHDISGTELRHRLENRLEIPAWFSFPEVIQTLQAAYPSRSQQGFTLFFTGLSGAGKSTLAKAVMARIMEVSQRSVSLLDGDIIRQNLSSELGFSRRDRDINIQRVGFVAAEITKHKGIAICAAIAPFKAARQQVRKLVSAQGGFVEIYVATPVNICKARDIKGLYAKAEAGLLTGFTGVDDPYEAPTEAELTIDTSTVAIDDAIGIILAKIEELGFTWK